MNRSEDKTNVKLLGMLGLAARARKLIAGTEIVTERIKSGKKVFFVIIASDVSENTFNKIKNCCEYYGVNFVKSTVLQEELSHSIGKMCLTSSVAILDQNFSDAVKKLV